MKNLPSVSSPRFLLLVVFSLVICCRASSYAQVAVSYSYPYPSSTEVSAKTTIGVRSGEALLKSVLQASSFTVIGTSSGKHTGKIVLALDGRTVIFTPDKIFSPGE